MRWYRWLRRELAAELGFAFRANRPRALTAKQEMEVFLRVIAVPNRQRTELLEQIAAQMGVGYTTLRRRLTEEGARRGVRSLKALE